MELLDNEATINLATSSRHTQEIFNSGEQGYAKVLLLVIDGFDQKTS